MLLDDLGDYLSTQGLGAVGAVIFKSTLPDAPDECISIFESGGFASVHTMSTGPGVAVMEQPTVQVICRSTRYDSARRLAQNVDLVLNGLRDVVINGISYQWAEAQQSPFQIGKDTQERHEVACNYRILKQVATSS